MSDKQDPRFDVATFAAGCFWCTDAIFKRLKGVTSIIPGYTGGKTVKPTSEQIYSGESGHAEAIQVIYDPTVISYDTLLDVFWHTHDPTSLNRQGADIGTQYRSAIFYHNESQRQKARAAIEKLEEMRVFANKVITEVIPFTQFYPAESYHKNFYDNNPDSPYCRIIIDPKIQKLLTEYKKIVKEEYQ